MSGFELSVSSNIKDVKKRLSRIQKKQIPFATAKALTDTAKDVQRAETAQLSKKLDRPTRFTLNAVGVRFATKRNLHAEVFIKPLQAEYLRWQIEGGTRRVGGAGTGVPTKNRKLNRYGNIAARRKGLVKGKKQFIDTIGGVTGVWQRYGGKRNPKLKLVVAFEKEVKYEKRFPFYKIASKVADNRFNRNFTKAINHALATAK